MLIRLKKLLPRSLFGRTLLIFAVATFIMLAAAAYVFFDRHWDTMTRRMTHTLSGDIAFVVELLEKSNDQENTANIIKLARDKMGINVKFRPERKLPNRTSNKGPTAAILKRALNDALPYPYVMDMNYTRNTILVQVGTPKGVYTIISPERRIYTPTTKVFVFWMVGSSILLMAIALLFMRNQIRPIRRLAEAADALGRGQEVPWFKIEGSSEVRQAGAALMVMRDRLTRQINQRTAMLAGVSHDLRTPLTRMRLQLELMGKSTETDELSNDINEMGEMLDAYLAFARGEEEEVAVSFDLCVLIKEISAGFKRQNFDISLNIPDSILITGRRNAMRRCITNLAGNALRYGKTAAIEAFAETNVVYVLVDDDGPGIKESLREEMFKPFARADESRNLSTGGVGLGLTIARDIARFHGGDVMLEDSPLRGLRAKIWLPL